jgi:hypothetical protein
MFSFYTPQNGNIKVLIFFDLCYDVRFEDLTLNDATVTTTSFMMPCPESTNTRCVYLVWHDVHAEAD